MEMTLKCFICKEKGAKVSCERMAAIDLHDEQKLHPHNWLEDLLTKLVIGLTNRNSDTPLGLILPSNLPHIAYIM